ncbi:ACT domain-containing protein [Stakelama pacifica]|uniref:ACT domain-containing protein n=1 Tax=Stakelama pacifica TaxID=517720 RepID=A0A4R6G0P7_9SPHN|nr:ACT domain-containing protein [Stakelama pacifica]MAX00512.1 hypothetical protein [Sphingomonas sp.]TDN87035.1 ACT domain-containing protein [Stakelama pacifica]GGO91412.1 hypothetical protein GCM10011329_06090 [Stakelama pacifica]
MSGTFLLRVEAESDAGLLARLVGLIAQRDMEILALDLRRWRQDVSEIRLTLMSPDAHMVDILVAKVEQMIGIYAAGVERSALAA